MILIRVHEHEEVLSQCFAAIVMMLNNTRNETEGVAEHSVRIENTQRTDSWEPDG